MHETVLSRLGCVLRPETIGPHPVKHAFGIALATDGWSSSRRDPSPMRSLWAAWRCKCVNLDVCQGSVTVAL